MQNNRAALYIRVSTDEQAKEGYSLDAQKKHLINYAKNNNFEIVDIYSDEGVSARKSYKKRREFVRLIADVQAGKIDIILFINLDRWFRNIADYYKIQEILDKYGVGWRATTEHYDTTTANGRLYVNIRLAIAQDEADRSGERIKFVFERKISDGEVVSGSLPLGYKIENKRIVIDPEKAVIVRELFRNYIALGSKRAAMLKVQKDFGCKLSYSSVLAYFKNTLYVGKYRDNPTYCPPIVDQEVFDRVQKMSEKTRKNY
ncbi:MAG: recombinase family protein [Peptostreptococcaceae bacterium]|nr:recombinase family protein [Peptostreptococcaceae bacterium]